MKSYLLNSVALFDKPDDKGADPEIARKAAIQAERDKITVTLADTKEDDEEIEAKDDNKDNDDDEQKDQDSGEEKEIEGGEGEEQEEDDKDADNKEVDLKAEKKLERLQRKLGREAEKRRAAERETLELRKKLEGKEKLLTEDEAEKLAETKADQKALLKEFNATVDRLAEGAQKQLKMTTKKFDAMVEEITDDLGPIPSQLIGILGDIDNGPVILAHILTNLDEAEELYKLDKRPAKLALELAKLSTKLAKPKKPISQVPDQPELLGGKSAGGDRLTILNNKKNLTQSETDEWVRLRNAEVAQARQNGRMNVR